MIIGIPKEIKSSENRVAMTPSGVASLVQHGHTVYVQHTAGNGSGFDDQSYNDVGAQILPIIEDVYASSQMIIKVKEPIESEYSLVRKDHILFTYFHFASHKPLTETMIDSGAVCIAYETVEKADGSLPLLIPMSEVAGRMSIQEGAKYLEKPSGGRGILLGGVPGVLPAHVVILGGGIVGTQAAKMAAGLGADVTILDINLDRLRYLEDVMPDNINTVYSNPFNIKKLSLTADLIVGAVLIPGAKAPRLITREMLKGMKDGAVLIDVAVDQGGCIETCRPTTHEDPIYVIDGVVHYCVANMPGAVPFTSTTALTNATLPYTIQLANQGWEEACRNNEALRKGLNVVDGKIVYEAVANAFDLDYTHVDQVM